MRNVRNLLLVALIGLILDPRMARAEVPVEASMSSQLTDGYWNGRFWRHLTAYEKITYMAGLEDSAKSVSSASMMTCEKADSGLIGSGTIGEFVEAVDQFYAADAARYPIPVVSAVRLHVMKERGATVEQLDAAVSSTLRRIASEPHN